MSIGMMAVVPKGPMRIDRFKVEIEKALQTEGRQDVRSLRRLTSTWSRKSKPKFETVIFSRGRDRVAFSFPQPGRQADIFGFVERGTRPHPIVARRAKALRFFRASSPKSVPGVGKSFQRRTFGAPLFRKRIPRHPGTKARNRIPVIERERAPKFQRLIRMAMKRGADSAWQ